MAKKAPSLYRATKRKISSRKMIKKFLAFLHSILPRQWIGLNSGNNSSDWFNRLDFTYGSNNWGVGLPMQDVNGDNWPIMQALLANPALAPGGTDIEAAAAGFRGLLEIRASEAGTQRAVRFVRGSPVTCEPPAPGPHLQWSTASARLTARPPRFAIDD